MGGESVRVEASTLILCPELRISRFVSGFCVYFLYFLFWFCSPWMRPQRDLYGNISQYMKMLTNGQLNFQPGIKRALGGGNGVTIV